MSPSAWMERRVTGWLVVEFGEPRLWFEWKVVLVLHIYRLVLSLAVIPSLAVSSTIPICPMLDHHVA